MSDKDGLDKTFEHLYKRYYRAVVAFFLRRGFPDDEARDLSQTTFVRVYRGMEAYRGEAKWAYLVEIAGRVASNEIRYRQAERRKVETLPLNEDMDHLPHLAKADLKTGEPPASALDEILSQERTRQLREAIAELAEEDRRYLEMWIAGYKYDEIMAVEQVSMDTVKSRLYRAKKRLKEALRKKLGDAKLDWPKDDES